MQLPRTISLDGEWDFFYSPLAFDGKASSIPEVSVFTGKMVIPGYWDDHYDLIEEEDFFGLEARFNPDYRKPYFPMSASLTPHACSSFLVGTGFYRKSVKLTEPGSLVLDIGPAVWGSTVFCNRKLVAKNMGYSTGYKCDLDGFFQYGEYNELIIVVCNVHDDGGAYCRADGSHDGEAVGARPGQHRGLAVQGYQSERAGIGGGISIRQTPSARIMDSFLSFDGTNVNFHVKLKNGKGCRLQWKMRANNTEAASGEQICQDDSVEFNTIVPNIHLWSDYDPFLYEVSLSLYSSDMMLQDTATQLWGARTIECKGTRILVNNMPVYFRGVTDHFYYPETANAHFDMEKYIHDFGILKQAGFNFIRCHTHCPPEPFLDACDKLGIFVQIEMMPVWSMEEALPIIGLMRKHTSAAILCEGNEKKITDSNIVKMRELAATLKRIAPGILFSPHEAMRLVEYAFEPWQKLTKEPFTHDAQRLAAVAEFSDLYGSLGPYSAFSYALDNFPGSKPVDECLSVFKKPCLMHEMGIQGGYIDFSLEKRYEGTFIGTDMFSAVREHMQRHGVYENAEHYYKNNCRLISQIRKQAFENVRSCQNATGYDFLGGIDTHWHLTGYPCGIFNEFYEEKYGETIGDVRRYNGENVLICSAFNHRNLLAGNTFSERIMISYFSHVTAKNATLTWSFETDDGTFTQSGQCGGISLEPGTLTDLATISFTLPSLAKPQKATLRVLFADNAQAVDNFWPFWLFPKIQNDAVNGVRVTDTLTDDDIDFAASGGAVLLTGNFPCQSMQETFRTTTSGRCIGHGGTIIHEHPAFAGFPHEEWADWQFYPMMSGSHSMIYNGTMPEFMPVFELIPAFKMVKHKSLLSEFNVGNGRIMMCGLVLSEADPAASYLKNALVSYLTKRDFAPAANWSPNDLKKRIKQKQASQKDVIYDAGGRPVASDSIFQ